MVTAMAMMMAMAMAMVAMTMTMMMVMRRRRTKRVGREGVMVVMTGETRAAAESLRDEDV